MGYYSDTTIVVEEKDFLRLIEAGKEEEYVLDLLEEATIKRYSECISLNWEHVRWNDCSPEVEFIEDFIENCPHYKIRFGESADDFEEDFEGDNQDFWDAAYPVRRIETAGEEAELSSFYPVNQI